MRLFFGNIDFHVCHGGDRQKIERARFQTRAFGQNLSAATVIEQRLGHLAAGNVMNTNAENFLHGS